jgi:hypothetical protein
MFVVGFVKPDKSPILVAKSCVNLVFCSLATEALHDAHSGEHLGRPNVQEFWKAMAEFYQSQAER